MADEASTAAARRRKFLVVVDKSPEYKKALRFAARRAAHTGGVVSLLTVVSPADFQHWRSVEDAMREEAMDEAEKMLYDAAREVNHIAGLIPEVMVIEGKASEVVMKLLKEDPDISILVLASGTSREGPGPLVSMVAQQSTQAYPIPVTIVPGVLSDEEIDLLA
ncbi:MAG: universal stress protein [Alphaproteobacteria bacterium]|jgi:nucleotide-binding universal stress UspA family protein|nr:universal stress protein [Alphaproteobacteria bacterium]